MKDRLSFPTLFWHSVYTFMVWGCWLHVYTVADHHGLGCCSLRFTKPVEGFALQGRVLKNISLQVPSDDVLFSQCRSLCGMESTCVSINIGLPGNDGVSLCQLSNSDHMRHPEDLKPQDGFLYWGTKNPCSSDPCLHNATCLSGFTDKRYVCLCPVGFKGENCEKIDFNAVFTNLGASGRSGPSLFGIHYTGQDHDGQVTLLRGIQQWTVPYTGEYRIEAIGAAGGYLRTGAYRGRGARMIGTFSLIKGEVIQILVGQEGQGRTGWSSSAGGGGTFVVRGSNTPLIIAGGGGGIRKVQSRHAGCDASTSTSGNPGYKPWSGGSDGHGAQLAHNCSSGGGGGGGGFYSSGRNGNNSDFIANGGKGFLQGGRGGNSKYKNLGGGFGGGASALPYGGGCGGGGGYSGGSSGNNEADSCGGGGGSYNNGTSQQNECCYNTAGHGHVTITFLQ